MDPSNISMKMKLIGYAMIIFGVILATLPFLSISKIAFGIDNIPEKNKQITCYNSHSYSWVRTVTASDGDKIVAKIKLGTPPIGTIYPCISLFHIADIENEGDIFFLEKAPKWQDDRPMVEEVCLILQGAIIVTAHKRLLGIPYTVSDTRDGINVLLRLSRVESGWRLVEASDFSTNGCYTGHGKLKMELSDD